MNQYSSPSPDPNFQFFKPEIVVPALYWDSSNSFTMLTLERRRLFWCTRTVTKTSSLLILAVLANRKLMSHLENQCIRVCVLRLQFLTRLAGSHIPRVKKTCLWSNWTSSYWREGCRGNQSTGNLLYTVHSNRSRLCKNVGRGTRFPPEKKNGGL